MKRLSIFIWLLFYAGGPAIAQPASGKLADAAFEADRKAILAMVGEYEVSFDFRETVPLKAGYSPQEAFHSGGYEFVEVLLDTGRHIALQHVLVTPEGDVTKHWRQDWEYQQPQLWAYVGDMTWSRRIVDSKSVKGAWTQTVWQVDDSPRYAGVGRWEHRDGISSWTSERVWRPLPLREKPRSQSYGVLTGINRQTITPDGWVHEEDNEKLDLKAAGGPQILVREAGVNTYRRIENFNFKPGRDELARSRDFWAAVHEEWVRRLASGTRLQLRRIVNERPLYEVMFQKLDEADSGKNVSRAAISSTLNTYLISP